MASIPPIFRTLLTAVSGNTTRLNGGTYSQTCGAATMTIFPNCLCPVTPLCPFTALIQDIGYSPPIARPPPSLLSSSCFLYLVCLTIHHTLVQPAIPPRSTTSDQPGIVVSMARFSHRMNHNCTNVVISRFAHDCLMSSFGLFALKPVTLFVSRISPASLCCPPLDHVISTRSTTRLSQNPFYLNRRLSRSSHRHTTDRIFALSSRPALAPCRRAGI